MTTTDIINELERNRTVITGLLQDVPETQIHWRPQPDKWNLVEVICHLVDEEIEDFHARTRYCLEHPEIHPPAIDPAGWVASRNYAQQDYVSKLSAWKTARTESIAWLRSLDNPDWNLGFDHAHFGRMTAGLHLNNWLAHDHLHMRQIIRMKFAYLKEHGGQPLNYAGDW